MAEILDTRLGIPVDDEEIEPQVGNPGLRLRKIVGKMSETESSVIRFSRKFY